MTSSTAVGGPHRGSSGSSPRTTRVNVACRGRSAAPRSRNAPANSSARGPLSLTTPNAPRPCGVAMAAMVSSIANNLLLRRDDDGLHERVADTLGRHRRILSDGEVHDAAFVRKVRPHFVRRYARAGLVRNEPRHLSELRVL